MIYDFFILQSVLLFLPVWTIKHAKFPKYGRKKYFLYFFENLRPLPKISKT